MLIRTVLAALLTVALSSAAMAFGSGDSKSADYQLGVKAVKAVDYGTAIKQFKKAVAADPKDADAWNYLGYSHRKMKQFDQAPTAYRKALAINPKHLAAHEYLGELYLQTGKLAKAKEQHKKLYDLCFTGCEEEDDLKKAVKAYEAAHKN